jgi:hypothetical protein
MGLLGHSSFYHLPTTYSFSYYPAFLGSIHHPIPIAVNSNIYPIHLGIPMPICT